jgi:hypothetical protein
MNNPALPASTAARSGYSGEPGVAKKFSTKIARNPLISLDSDERIQGNPSFSNPQKLGFSPPNGEAPRKPK